MKTPELDKRTQLHEEILIFYTPVEYIAQFSTMDGQRQVIEARGDTIGEALEKLEVMAAGLPESVKEIRSIDWPGPKSQ
jgi:hypothetical protein